MKLSMKLFRIILISNLLLILFLYIFSEIFLLKNFTNIEIDNTHTDTKAVLNYIQKDLSNLDSMNLDYARWDDSYNYLNNRNDDYITSNFNDTTSMARARVSFVFITDSLGNIVYKKNIQDDTEDMFTEAFAKNITSDVFKLLSDNNTENIKGIVQYDNNPILVSAERITKSDGSGHSPGFLIFAKYYDQDEIDIISENTNIQTELLHYDSNLILNNDSAKKDTFVKVNNQNLINGYGVLNNIFSKPTLFVKVTMPRNIFNSAQKTVNFYLLVNNRRFSGLFHRYISIASFACY